MKVILKKVINYYQGIKFIPVVDGRLVNFNSSLDKVAFINTHREGTYQLDSNCAVEFLYMVIDTDGTGFVISNTAVTFNQAVDLVNHYL